MMYPVNTTENDDNNEIEENNIPVCDEKIMHNTGFSQSAIEPNSSKKKRTFEEETDKIDSETANRKKLKLPDKFYCSGSGVKHTLHGVIYQVELLVLIALKAETSYDTFKLSSENDEAESFDDIVIKYKNKDQKWAQKFLQAKHRVDASKKKITLNDLKTSKDDDFSVQKYFLSFCTIKLNPNFNDTELEEFMLCTNTSLNLRKADWMGIIGEESLSKNHILAIGNDQINQNIRLIKFVDNEETKKVLTDLFTSIFFEKVGSKLKVIQSYKIETKYVESFLRYTDIQKKYYTEKGSVEYKELSKVKEEIFNVYKVLKAYKSSVRKFSKTSLKIFSLDKYMTESNLKKIDRSDSVEECQDIVESNFQKLLPNLTPLLLLLDEKLFKEYLKEFLELFQIITNYPNVDDLCPHLLNMFGERFNLLNPNLSAHSFQNFIVDWMRYYRNGKSYCLSRIDVNDLIKKIEEDNNIIAVIGLKESYVEKLNSYRLQFDCSVKNFEDWYRNLQNHSCIVLKTNLTGLMANYIVQNLKKIERYKARDSFFIETIETLTQTQTQNLVLASCRSLNSFHLLIIEWQKKAEKELIADNLLAKLKAILKYDDNKKLIIILNTEQVNSNMEKLDELLNEVSNKTYNLEFYFNSLNTQTQQYLLDQDCEFQGKTIKLNKLINATSAQKTLDRETFNKLIRKKLITIGNDESFTFDDSIEMCYVERRLHLQTLNIDLLQKQGIEGRVFMVSGTNSDQFHEQLLDIGFSKEDISTHFKWHSEAENEDIDSMQNDNMDTHWFEYINENLYWKKSTEYDKIQNFINTQSDNVKNFIREEDFNLLKNVKEKIVIVANESGFGKSTFLTSLANKMRNIDESLWILRINLRDYAFIRKTDNQRKSLKEITFDVKNVAEAINYIGEMSCRNLFEKSLLKLSLSNSERNCLLPKIVIMLDGFDEISPGYSKETITLIKALESTNVIQIFITTRRFDKNRLEKELKCTAYILKYFDQSEQINFLNNFWRLKLAEAEGETILGYLDEIKSNIDVSSAIENLKNCNRSEDMKKVVNSIDFTNFSTNLLDRWQWKIKDNDQLKATFTVVPLHLRMLAEIIFSEKFQLNVNFNVLDMYTKFIETKYDISYKTIGPGEGAEHMKFIYTKWLEDMFYSISFDVLLPDINITDFKGRIGKDIKSEDIKPLERTGLIVLKGQRLDFIHRTYAAYFISKFAVNNISFEPMQKIIVKTLLYEDKFDFIREFMDSFLEREPLNDVQFSKEALKSIFIRYGFNNILHIASIENRISVFKFLLDVSKRDIDIFKKLLLTDGKYDCALDEIIYNPRTGSRPELFPIILDKMKSNQDILKTALTHESETYGMITCGLFGRNPPQTSFTILEKIIITRKDFKLLSMMVNEIKKYPEIYLAVVEAPRDGLLNFSSYLPKEQFKEFLRIISVDNQEIMEKIILTTNTFCKETILHLLVRHDKMYLDYLLNWLSEKKYSVFVERLFRATDKNKLTALEVSVIIENHENTITLMNFLKNYNLSSDIFKEIICKNDTKNILFTAVSQGKTKITSSLLTWFSNNIEKEMFSEIIFAKSVCKRTALQIGCARGFLDTLRVFLQFFKNYFVDLLPRVILFYDSETILSQIIRWKQHELLDFFLDFLSTQVLLEDTQALLNIIYREGNILHIASRENEEGLKKLLQFILDHQGKEILVDLLHTENMYGQNVLRWSMNNEGKPSQILLNFINDNISEDFPMIQNLVSNLINLQI